MMVFFFFFLQIGLQMHKSCLTVFMKLKVGYVVTGQKAQVHYHIHIRMHQSDFSSNTDSNKL